MLGNILNDTTKRIKILATNPNSEFPVKCSWSFIDDKLNTNKSVTSIPLSQIFDVVPLTSLVFPGQAQEFEFSLFGYQIINLMELRYVRSKVDHNIRFHLSVKHLLRLLTSSALL
jgi:hypothetical protein